MLKSRQQKSQEPKLIYCRKCQKTKTPLHFLKATDLFLDSNGFMSICKECVDEIYNNFIKNDQSMDKTILRMCKLLNVRFDENALESAKKHIDKFNQRGHESSSVFGIYKSKLLSVSETALTDRNKNEDMTFVEPSKDVVENLESPEILDIEYYENIWGKNLGLEKDDYEFLEKEYEKWIGSTGEASHSEEVLIRDICHIQNQIRKERIEGSPARVNSLIESRQKIMKDGALTPALQNAANNGRNIDCFGKWIKDIEQHRPAEWFDQQAKYHDMDGIEEDILDIKRSIKNFTTNSRDFNSVELEKIGKIEDVDEDGG